MERGGDVLVAVPKPSPGDQAIAPLKDGDVTASCHAESKGMPTSGLPVRTPPHCQGVRTRKGPGCEVQRARWKQKE
jgi:hypothetical protein